MVYSGVREEMILPRYIRVLMTLGFSGGWGMHGDIWVGLP